MSSLSAEDALIPADHAEVLVDPKAYADDRIYGTYSWLRANQPFGYARPDGYDPFWVASRHADILEISRQNDLFHSADLATTLTNKAADSFVRKATGTPHLVRSLVQMDPPDHPKYRTLTQGWFMPNNLKSLETRVRQIARSAVDKMIAKGSELDFVNDVALHYPLHVIMEILGVPEADEGRMLRLTQELFGPTDPDTARAVMSLGPEAFAAAMQAVVVDFENYFKAISEDRRQNPRDDLATVIANARIDGELISDREANGYYMIVATAGHDTTSSSTAGALWALANDPGEFAKVKADPSLIPTLVDEAIRWTTPVKTFMRSATADTTIAGRHIAKGDWIMLCYASGNRDEAVFDEPDRFRADRKPNKQLAFGYGAHLCLGQHLARLEMRILFEELLPRLRSVELAGPLVQSQSYFVNGPKSLPIRVAYENA
jgi:cytochrome P450